ncbi:MAG TPA: hypothetical protein VGB18_04390 [Candidatus Thermoplasmatota archaeon]
MNEEAPKSDDKVIAAPLDEVRRARGETMVAVPLEQVRSVRGQAVVALPRSKVASLRAFRRIRADRVLGTIGIIFVLLGILLIFTWEKPPEVVKKYGVEWQLETLTLENDNNTLVCTATGCPGAESERTYTIDVNQTNVTAVTVWLQWIDDVVGENEDQSEGDILQLTITGPDGTNITNVAVSKIGGSGGENISLTYPMSGIPDVGAVQPADNDEEAYALLGDRTNRTGIGAWSVTVKILRAGDDWGDSPLGDELQSSGQKCPANSQMPVCDPDSGNPYNFGFQIIRYTVAIEKQY